MIFHSSCPADVTKLQLRCIITIICFQPQPEFMLKKCIIEIKWFCVTCYFYFTNHPVFFCVLLLYGQHVMSCPYKPKEHLCWNKEFCSKFSQKCNNKLGNHLHSYLRSNQGKGHFQINLKKSLIWQNLLSVLQFINEGKWFTPNVSDFIMSLLKCKN